MTSLYAAFGGSVSRVRVCGAKWLAKIVVVVVVLVEAVVAVLVADRYALFQ